MGFEFGIVGGLAFKGHFPALVVIACGVKYFFCFFRTKLCIVGRCALEFGLLWRIFVAAVLGSFGSYLFGLVVFIILCFPVELAGAWSVVVPVALSITLIFYFVWGVLCIISSFQHAGIVVPFVVMIGAGSLQLLDDSAAGFIVVMVCCFPFKGPVSSRRAVVLPTCANLADALCIVFALLYCCLW